MTPFLKQIARQYFADGEKLSQTVFVFPSRRAVVFFNKYLAQVAKESGKSPVIMPKSLTMDDFLLSLSDLRKSDRITQVLELYSCYCEVSSKHGMNAESLDDFIFWADMILSDFNDIDKYLVDAHDLLRNIAEYRKIKDDFSYLSDTQRKAMENFMGHFGKMNAQGNLGEYKQRFADIWDMLYPMYVMFNDSMQSKGLSYEGAVYRRVTQIFNEKGAEAAFASAYPESSRVAFCGLNALNECEKKVMDALKRLDMAQFCWDYVSPMIKDKENRSSFFMEENIVRFGNDINLEKCNTVPQIEIISVSSAVGQAKLLDVIMKENPSVKTDETTAVMLADENLLLPVLSSIPPNVETVNVTMGYPMASSSFYSLIDDICQMILRTRQQDGKTQIYHKLAWSIVGNNIFTSLADNQTMQKVAEMKKARRYFIDSEDLSGTALLNVIFKCPAMDVESIRTYLLSIVDFIGESIASDSALKDQMALEMDLAMSCSKVLNLLSEIKLELSPSVWLHVLEGLLSSTSIPFAGEPLCGLQIMGPLETRALDFENLIILSANESVFPRKSVASSFIPPMLRKDFGLPTYEYQDAVWAYYFYRMIQRPSKVWMILDSRPDGLNSSEESRYIKQLKYHFNLPVVSRYANAAPERIEQEIVIEKTPEILEKLHSHPVSASVLKNYADCPLKFYYSFVEGLENEDEVSETMDGGMIGNVFHNTMEELFNEVPDHKVTLEVLEKMRSDKEHIMQLVRFYICNELRYDQLHGREVVFARIIRNNIVSVLGWDMELLKNSGADYFMTYPECKLHSKIDNFEIKGRLDRMDIFPDGRLRIVDYKTGRLDNEKFAVQLFIYSYLVHYPKDPSKVPAFNSLETYIYSTRSFSQGLPQPQNQNPEEQEVVSEQVKGYLKELDDLQIPFRACQNTDTCKYCDFLKICNRCSR